MVRTLEMVEGGLISDDDRMGLGATVANLQFYDNRHNYTLQRML